MASAAGLRCEILCALLVLVLLQFQVFCYQYKVGDLDAWGIPTSANSQIYTDWPRKHSFQTGDSLLFLYPPSQDSVVQVTEQAYNSCNVTDPILFMKDGNSVFNITSKGTYFFTSGAQGHCKRRQKLKILVGFSDGSDLTPSTAPLPASSPAYANVFGSIPTSSAMHSRVIFFTTILAISSTILDLSQHHLQCTQGSSSLLLF